MNTKETFEQYKTIPGTHDSGATISESDNGPMISFVAKCQTKSITQQLNMGIRYLDMRIQKHYFEILPLSAT